MLDLILFENGENRTPQPDQRPARNRGRPLRQGLELQPGAVVVEQDAAVEIAHDDGLREFGHERRETILLFLDRSLGARDLGIDVVHQLVALLRQVVGGLGELLHLRRPVELDAEIAVGAEHQTQGFRHPQQAFDILLEQLVQDHDADREPEQRHHRADRQARDEQLGEHVAFGVLHVQPDEQGGDDKGPGHQQTEHDNGKDETMFGLHGRLPDEISPAFRLFMLFRRSTARRRRFSGTRPDGLRRRRAFP